MAKRYGDDDKRSERGRYLALKAGLWSERSSFDSHWRELANQFLPRRARFQVSDRNRGERMNQHIYDSTGRFAVRTLQSGLHAGLTSPARPWFKLTTPDPKLAEFGPVQDWLHVATQRMQAVFGQSNLYQSLPMLYGDFGVFGTGAMGVLPDSRDLFRTFTYPIGSFAIGLDRRRMVTTWVHEYEMTVRQVVEEFGVRQGYRDIDWSNISDHVKRAWNKGDYEETVELCWIVVPNEDRQPNRLEAWRSMPWLSLHFESSGQGDKTLRRGGYEQFPVMVPRWEVTGEDTYGTSSPGMDALGDSKQLQSAQRQKGRAIAKMIDPPLQAPTALLHQATSILPAAVTHVDVGQGMPGVKPIHEVNLRVDHLANDIQETQFRVNRAFYVDLFMMLANSDRQRGMQPMTAEEVRERHEEKLLALGPVLERTNDELLDPLVDRVFAMMQSAGLLPDPPEELDGVKLSVQYTSIMAQAQKLVGVVGQDRMLQTMIPIMEQFPEAKHKLDVFRVIDNYQDMLGVDPRMIRSSEEAQALADEDRRAQQTAQTALNAAQLGKAAKDAAAAPLEGNTALTQVLEGMGASIGAGA
jgi:hypothetical protein